MSHLSASTFTSGSGHGRNSYATVGQDQAEKDDYRSSTGGTMKGIEDVDFRTAASLSHIHLLGLLVDVLLSLVSIAVIIFVCLGYRASGNALGAHEQSLIDIAQIVATAFPFVFALILGRALTNVLSYCLEKGINCLSFAYLSRSLTLGGAYTAPFQIRLRHWLPAVLLVYWTFSPIGSQAFLRFIVARYGRVTTQLQEPAHYIVPSATLTSSTPMKNFYPSGTSNATCDHFENNGQNLVFTSFLSLGSMVREPLDNMGNLKIPVLDDSNFKGKKSDWRQVSVEDEELSHPEFAALTGIPFSLPNATRLEPQNPGNITFRVQSWYWQLEDPILHDTSSPGSLLQGREYNGSKELVQFGGSSRRWQFGLPSRLNTLQVTSIPITFDASHTDFLNNSLDLPWFMNAKNCTGKFCAVRLEATLVQKPVELNVTCIKSRLCTVISLRPSTMPMDYDVTTDMIKVAESFLQDFGRAFACLPYVSGVLEAYLFDPMQNPYSLLEAERGIISLFHLDAETLGLRLSQILNTYWMVQNFFLHISGSFNASDPALTLKRALQNATVTETKRQDVLHYDPEWGTLLFISTTLMLFAAVASTVLRIFRTGPDVLDFISALSLHNGTALLDDGSYLDSDERIRLLKDVRLKIGDADVREPVGRIVVGREEAVGDLRKGRLYI
ncbi:hypothetical protein BU24DRAFT_448696 [Aaosphaeria arxii CBS 175.79]|uniref:Uncharacterized protein n=1 Tax=Aaosphaeria arxii CBS 175.79 TaxID=1450172 RepID=A0A6A5XUM3_9PLEO|nr:uncharacterized protein BU24DRAFT_448696 [Aaosphaeria arxii CBS 175.79]KAF2016902.1 hypothetical protein BU24DRAFT_448696 [Aaosphaeria arxii CBS 175.79]